ncbi:MAG: thioredoxin domain-containing protein, partial [Gemmatimonadetes bacterium]|nr:thioredoxin domain-containing protein [Gemmatimonadota bacterium]
MRIRLIFWVALVLAFGLGPNETQAQAGLEDVGFVFGDTAAPVKIIEFGDFGCTTCADFWRDSWPRVRHELIETGRVVWWHVPVT